LLSSLLWLIIQEIRKQNGKGKRFTIL